MAAARVLGAHRSTLTGSVAPFMKWERVARQRRRRLPEAHVESRRRAAAGGVNQTPSNTIRFRLVFV